MNRTLRAVAVLLVLITIAADAPSTAPVRWTARSTTGVNVAVPIPDKVTVVAFLRPGQGQSDDAVKQIAAAADPAVTAVIVVTSGQNAPGAVEKFIADDKINWPVVLDVDYALAGTMSVRVWPTTLVVAADGSRASHLAGLPQSFAADLPAYIDFAARKIDAATLESRLATTRQAVSDSPEQIAARHAHIAADLLDKGQADQAQAEIDQGLKRSPENVNLRVMQVRALLKQKRPDAALSAADHLNNLAPPWQVSLLRAEALIALQRWSDAKEAATGAINLNPMPASAYYQLGQVYAHDKDWQQAADAFRRAYESTQPR
jgi:tetratricopeptide (TPR) repeat protein